MSPISLLATWVSKEQQAGAPNPQQAVLSTCGLEAIAHARVIAIRELSDDGFLFFTQSPTRKVSEITENPVASLVFWFELYQREVVVEGKITALSAAENEAYWNAYPRESQIRFMSYAPTSSQPISDKSILSDKKKQIEQAYADKVLPLSPHYRGYRLHPERFMFYAFRTDELSDVFEFRKHQSAWVKQWLSP